MAPAKEPSAKPKTKPKSKFTDRAQSERFIEATQRLGIEDTSKFDDTLKKILPQATVQSK